MAWIESHQELRGHPKTKRLAKKLGTSIAAAIGHLHLLWYWAVDYAPDGDLTEYEDWEIADAAGYEEEDPARLKDALIFSGFLDNTEQGTFIHDWNDYAGRTLEQREKAKRRSKEYRDRKANETQKTRTPSVKETETNGERMQSERIRNVYGTESEHAPSASTEHNITEHNITEHNNTEQDSTVQNKNTPPIPPTGGGEGDPLERPPTLQEQRFDEFWETYPKKKSKESARKAWAKIKPDTEKHQRIIQSIKDHMARDPNWRKENGQFIPYPATWLNAGGWEDELPKATQTTMGGEHNAGSTGGYADFRASTGFRRADPITDA